PFDGLAALDRLAVAVDGPGREIALAVGERLEELGREAVRQVIENVFARRDVDLHVAPFLGWDLGEAPLHQRLAGRDDLDDGGMAGFEIALDRTDQCRGLHRGEEVKKRCLALSKAERAADLAWRFSVPVWPVTLAASSAAVRLLWMIRKAPA